MQLIKETIGPINRRKCISGLWIGQNRIEKVDDNNRGKIRLMEKSYV